jgi:hypothetical protein
LPTRPRRSISHRSSTALAQYASEEIFPAIPRARRLSNASRTALTTVSAGMPFSRQPRIRPQSFDETRNGVPRSAMNASSIRVA